MSEKRPIIISELKDDEIMKKAIHKAKANGWKAGIIHRYFVRKLYSEKQFFFHTFYNDIDAIILSHSFAKAFWGEEYISMPYYYDGDEIDDFGDLAWRHHLQRMVLEKNRIKYLEKFL